MENTNLVSWVSLALSFIAIVAAGVISYRQVALMRQANQLPVFIELLQEFRSTEFLEHQHFVLKELRAFDAATGYSSLPFEARCHLVAIFDFIASMACLRAFKVITIEHVVATYAFLLGDLWAEIRPFVDAERELKGREIGVFVQSLVDELAEQSTVAVARRLGVAR